MRRILAGAVAVLAAGAFLFFTLGSSHGPSNPTYKIQLDNAFGLVNGADFKVAGVIAGTIKSIDLPQGCIGSSNNSGNPGDCHAQVTVSVSQKGFGAFHQNVFCESRPQSLIGEYFINCDPGTQGAVWPSSQPIPVTHTQSTIPADLVQNIMRYPYRQRFSILINELGAAVASRSEDLQSALKRADPALAETDNLLALLANDASTIRDLNQHADTVVTALAKNSNDVKRFLVQAKNISQDTISPRANAGCGSGPASCTQATWEKLPAFLTQLREGMAKLGAAADAQDPVLQNLNAASGNLDRFFSDLVPFSNESLPSLRSLGKASVTGKPAVQAARPLARHLNQFSLHTPELAQNLAIVLHDLDDRGRAIEADPRSPDGGKGYTGVEALLEYVFNITLAINYFSPTGHELGVDAFANSTCSPYATPQTIANNISSYVKGGGDLNSYNGMNPRSCYAFLGPDQQGVTTADPTWRAPGTAANPSACVPDPGGYPVQGFGTHYYGAKTSVCKLQAQTPSLAPDKGNTKNKTPPVSKPPLPSNPITNALNNKKGVPPINLQQTINQILSTVGGATGTAQKTINKVTGAAGGAANTATNTAQQAAGGGGGLSQSQTQQLLNYLLAP
jgi:ABC-type transporter Mla subunit MlaD